MSGRANTGPEACAGWPATGDKRWVTIDVSPLCSHTKAEWRPQPKPRLNPAAFKLQKMAATLKIDLVNNRLITGE
jgi:hypothetical protein